MSSFLLRAVVASGLAVASAPAAEIQVPGALVKLSDQLDVPAQEAGSLVELAVQEGARVASGAALARLDDTQARFTENRAQAELALAAHTAASDIGLRSAQRSLQAAESELQRAVESRAKLRSSVTEGELEKLQLAADQARLAVEKAQHDAAAARLTRDLKQVEVDFASRQVARRQATAPFPGVVVQIFRRVGEWVEPGDKLLRVIRLDRLRVEGLLDAAQAVPGLDGKPVTLTVDLPGQAAAAFQGQLLLVSPEIDPINRTVRVLAEIDNPRLALQPGLRGVLTIHTAAAPKPPLPSSRNPR